MVWDGGPADPGDVSLRFLMFGEVDIYSFWWESEAIPHPLANDGPRATAGTATLSNVELPLDQNGEKLVTGEADVLKHGDTYFLYFNNFGDCPGVDWKVAEKCTRTVWVRPRAARRSTNLCWMLQTWRTCQWY